MPQKLKYVLQSPYSNILNKICISACNILLLTTVLRNLIFQSEERTETENKMPKRMFAPTDVVSRKEKNQLTDSLVVEPEGSAPLTTLHLIELDHIPTSYSFSI
jgi:hypothetical protein